MSTLNREDKELFKIFIDAYVCAQKNTNAIDMFDKLKADKFINDRYFYKVQNETNIGFGYILSDIIHKLRIKEENDLKKLIKINFFKITSHYNFVSTIDTVFYSLALTEDGAKLGNEMLEKKQSEKEKERVNEILKRSNNLFKSINDNEFIKFIKLIKFW